MENKKHRGSNLDELAIVKAAAWTWYQHGSGAEGRPMREYDLARTRKPREPSRYKLEAMRGYVQEREDPKQISLMSPLSTSTAGENSADVSLLDTYEIERISRQLHSYMESSRVKHLKTIFGGDNRNRQPGHRKIVSLSESGTSEKKSKLKDKTSTGFWPVICGSGRHNVVEVLDGARRISFEGSSRRKEKTAPVVKGCGSSSPRRGVHA